MKHNNAQETVRDSEREQENMLTGSMWTGRSAAAEHSATLLQRQSDQHSAVHAGHQKPQTGWLAIIIIQREKSCPTPGKQSPLLSISEA